MHTLTKAGISVALCPVAMRLSEAITIYLAIGAPFGVSYFLRAGQQQAARTHALLKSTGALLLWPVTAAIFLFLPPLSILKLAEASATTKSTPGGQRIEQAERELLAALYQVAELSPSHSSKDDGALEQATREVRAGIERHVELTQAAANFEADAPPSTREMELCRIAGRTGDDLLTAGRCTHRRNRARLVAHQARSRTELLHALANLREQVTSECFGSSKHIQSARHLSVAFLKFYGHAVNLLSLLEDERAAGGAARLLDAECARLRRLEALCQDDAPATDVGEESCTHQYYSTVSARSQTTQLTQG